jgi:cell division protein FtsQ
MWDDHRLLNQIAAALCALAALSVVYAAVVLVVRLPVFALGQVRVTGEIAHTTRNQVAAIAGELRGTFFTLDLEQARAAFEKLPWVRRAQVRRAWPDRLDVTVEEHVALARWHDVGLVNTHGEVFQAASSAALPVFVGPPDAAAEMAAHYGQFRASLAAIGRSPAELRLSGRRAWQIRLDDGRLLELGRQDVVARLERFVGVYPRIAAQLPDVRHRVDLRYPNGFAVRVPGLRWGDRLPRIS